MKSYFAKLADRATLPNVPAASMVHSPRIPDPFDASAEPASAKISKQKPAYVPTQATRVVSHKTNADSTREILKADRPAMPERSLERTDSESKNQEHAQAKTEKSEPLQPWHSRVADNSDVSSSLSLSFNKEEPSTLSQSSKKSADPEERRIISPDEDSELEAESYLMRKADEFMARILATEFPAEQTTEPAVIEKTTTKFVEEQRPSLNPQPVQRTTTTDTQGPSLVIGKLNVEVIPSPMPVAPTPERIVVRRHGVRVRGLPSTRRFGLGQF